jgi:isopenicillin N synthase-like dioxygenase
MMNVLTIDLQEPNAGELLVTSLHETGFAILRNHSIARDMLDDIYRDWQAFFDSDDKYQYSFDAEGENDIQDGFYALSVSEKAVGATQKDNKEFYHVVPGGRVPPDLESNIFSYREQAMRLGIDLLSSIQRHTPKIVTDRFSKPIADVLSDTATLLRVLHYPKLVDSDEGGQLRAAPHEDINFLTILPVAKEPGLQVKGNDDSWIDLEGFTGDLIINNGDMLQEASGGYFPSTTHRVINPNNQSNNVSRISMPFFLTPDLEFVLSERYTAGSYLNERLQLISGQSEHD